MITASQPACCSLRINMSINGWPRMGKRGLGSFFVRGNRRVPRPAAKIIAFIRGIMPARQITVKKAAAQSNCSKTLLFVVPHVSI